MSEQVHIPLNDPTPFDIEWARSILPDGRDGVTSGRNFYSFKQLIDIGRDGESWLLEINEVHSIEMKTRWQFFALCMGLGIFGTPSNG